jgi:ATP-binding cassette subfamily C protein CydCD
VLAFIGVGVAGALTVLALKHDQPFGLWQAALFALAPAAGLLHWLESWLAHDLAFRLLAQMRIDLFHKLDALAPAYLVRRRSGDLVSMATQDVEMVEYFFAHTIAPTFVAVLVPAAVVATLFAFDWSLAAALLPFLMAVAASPFFLRERIDSLASRVREALGVLNAHAVDSVQGLGEILAFQQEEARKATFLDVVRRHHHVRLPFFRDLTRQTALLEVMTGLGGLAVVAAGGRLVGAGDLDGAFLPLLTLMAMAAFLPISEIADVSRQLADTLGATRRLHAVHTEEAPVRDGPLTATAATGKGTEIEFHGVTFRYPGTGRTALRHVDLKVPAGATIALVGPSGAGKTTMAHLLLRFWDPQEGSIELGGHGLPDYRLDALRAQVALVAQDTYLFNDTLRANVLIARPEAGEAELRAALRRAALEDFTASLPMGLKTPVGERGMTLSGGQRQRVAIARAFLRDAPVLVLDEATSHLDAVSERLVHHALAELMQGRTTIVIAHRLSTVRNADMIVVLDGGHIAEQGNHKELLARGGLYARLVSRQVDAGSAVAS